MTITLASLAFGVGLYVASSDGPEKDVPAMTAFPSWCEHTTLPTAKQLVIGHLVINGAGQHYVAARPPYEQCSEGAATVFAIHATAAGALDEQRSSAIAAAALARQQAQQAQADATQSVDPTTPRPRVISEQLLVDPRYRHSDRSRMETEVSASGGRVVRYEVENTPTGPASGHSDSPRSRQQRKDVFRLFGCCSILDCLSVLSKTACMCRLVRTHLNLKQLHTVELPSGRAMPVGRPLGSHYVGILDLLCGHT